MLKKLRKWWLFHLANPVVRKGEHGGFKWVFRRFWMEISTLSGNFELKFIAGEHPYGYLVSGKDDENIEGFCQMMYSIGMLMTRDQKLVDGVTNEIKDLMDRMEKEAKVEEDKVQERIDLDVEQKVQEHVEGKPKRYRRKGDSAL